MLYGPNTNLGHNSILVMIKAQVGYILDAIRQMDARGLGRLDVKREVMDEYNRALQRDLARSVWAADKQSWYKLADGTITNNWPHSTIRYRRLLRSADLGAFDTAGDSIPGNHDDRPWESLMTVSSFNRMLRG